ncbi:MAG: peptidylprolyl isomerase [Acidimicrobiia bacterium]|nr:peptidylprolyl isomerase [Acidimicrobiia bacterium]
MSRSKANKEAARKQRQKQAQRKQLLATLRRFGIATIIVVVVLGLASILSSKAGPLGETYDEIRTFPVACGGNPPPEITTRQTFPEATDQGLTENATATVVTSCGTIEIALDLTTSPTAANTFAFLANQGYYNGTAAHQLLPQFVKFGDPTATGLGNPGFTFQAEKPPADFEYTRGVVALGLNETQRNDGQFFIVLADKSTRAPNFSPIGVVTAGQDVLDKIAAIKVQLGVIPEISQPAETIYIESITINP